MKAALMRSGKLLRVVDGISASDQIYQEDHKSGKKHYVETFMRDLNWGECPCCDVVVFRSVRPLDLPRWVK